MSLDLKSLRQEAGLTQDQLAKVLDIAQSQVSRYEDEPGSMPHALWRKWIQALGLDPATAEAADENTERGIAPADAFAALEGRLKLVEQYCESAAPDVSVGLPDALAGLPSVGDLRRLVHELRRKPNVVLTGKFDAGKSRMANSLMGEALLPVGWQPETRLITYVRHVDDRPSWATESVYFFKRGFSLPRWDDETQWHDHQVKCGGPELLAKHGVYPKRSRAVAEDIGAETVVVFSAAPILKVANLIDLPGHRETEEGVDQDKERATTIFPMVDVLIYAANHAGFLGGTDFANLAYFIRALPPYELHDPSFPLLGNLFIVATHAAPHVSERALREEILDVAADRLWEHLGETAIQEREGAIRRTIARDDLRARFFGWWAERQTLRDVLHKALEDCLGGHVPRARIAWANKQLVDFKSGAKGLLLQQLESLRGMLQDLDEARRWYEQLVRGEQQRQKELRSRRAEVEGVIATLGTQAQAAFDASWQSRVTVEAIELTIRRRYANTPDPKGDARKFAAAYVLELIQHDLAQSVSSLAGDLAGEVDRYLAAYSKVPGRESVLSGLPPLEIPFDTKGAFIGGAAGAGVIGALALWASSLGNLGAYIIAAKATSVLAMFGISVTGGTAAVMSFVAGIGGPVILAAGLFVGVGALLWSFFGESWQRRLAKRIERELVQRGTYNQLSEGISRYWTDTLAAFRAGAQAVERDYRARIAQYEAMLAKPTEAKAKTASQTRLVEALWTFFSGIPV